MIVEDAHKDQRFLDNELVTGDPYIRFYAGAPLTLANGTSLGTLCVIDRKPRKLNKSQCEALEVLRDAVVAQIELRRSAEDLRALAGIVPMCAWCRKVRIEGNEPDEVLWEPLHDYVARMNTVTHGICGDCKEIALHEIPDV